MLAVTEFRLSNTFCVIEYEHWMFKYENISVLLWDKKCITSALKKNWWKCEDRAVIPSASCEKFRTFCKIQCLLTVNRILLWGKCTYLLFFFNIICYPACFGSMWSIIREITNSRAMKCTCVYFHRCVYQRSFHIQVVVISNASRSTGITCLYYCTPYSWKLPVRASKTIRKKQSALLNHKE
jgi:hypothetical protein